MFKFALTGVHDSGKTTLLSKIERELSHRKISCVRITEVAQTCPLQIGLNTTFDTQTWMFAEQMQQEIIAMTYGAQVVLCDRTLLDNVMYMQRLADSETGKEPERDLIVKAMHRLALTWIRTYDYVVRLKLNMAWLLKRDKDKGTVAERTSFAEMIERRFDYWELEYADIAYSVVPDACDVADLIEERLIP